MSARRLYGADLADAILGRLAAGEALRTICAEEGMPTDRTVRAWAADDIEGFAARYRQARETSAQHWDEEAERVLREAPGEKEEIARARELAQHFRWRASKMAPREYGDRLDVNHTGTVAVAVLLSEARHRMTLLEGHAEPVALPQPGEGA